MKLGATGQRGDWTASEVLCCFCRSSSMRSVLESPLGPHGPNGLVPHRRCPGTVLSPSCHKCSPCEWSWALSSSERGALDHREAISEHMWYYTGGPRAAAPYASSNKPLWLAWWELFAQVVVAPASRHLAPLETLCELVPHKPLILVLAAPASTRD